MGSNSINKKMKLQEGEGYDYFQNLPDDILVLIFTKLSNSGADDDTFDDIQSLGRCSSVSKRFNAVSCLVPVLTIKNPSIFHLCWYCPKILKKFKHIRSLDVQHYSTPEAYTFEDPKKMPCVFWDAVYEPQNYCLAVVTCTHVVKYKSPQQRHSMMHFQPVPNKKLYRLSYEHALCMFYLHHMLVASIKEHKMLQEVVVSNFVSSIKGVFHLDEDKLVKLRNCSINLEKIETRHMSCLLPKLDFPLTDDCGGIMDNMCLNIFEWWEKSTGDIHMGFPPNLPCIGYGGRIIHQVLTRLFDCKGDLDVSLKINDSLVSKRLSDINSDGSIASMDFRKNV